MTQPTHIEEKWEIEFQEYFEEPFAQWTGVAVKDFIRKLLTQLVEEDKVKLFGKATGTNDIIKQGRINNQ